MLLGIDILILTVFLSCLISLFKEIKLKYILILIGINLFMLLPVFMGYDYHFLWVGDILYLFLIFLIGVLLFKAIYSLKIKYLNYLLIFCITLFVIIKLRNGLDYYYRVDIDHIVLENKYLVCFNGIKVKTSNVNEYRYRSMPVIHKFYFNGILRKQLKRRIVEIDEHVFEDILEDGTVIIYDNGKYSIKEREGSR